MRVRHLTQTCGHGELVGGASELRSCANAGSPARPQSSRCSIPRLWPQATWGPGLGLLQPGGQR